MAGGGQLSGQEPTDPYWLLQVLARPRAALRRHLPLVWRRRLAVLVGGWAGSAMRIAVGVVPHDVESWPWSTFTVNLTGAFTLGYLLTRFQQAAASTVLTIPLLCTGLLGAYTTFSAVSAETLDLWVAGRAGLAVGYAAASTGAGYVLAVVGIRLAERRP